MSKAVVKSSAVPCEQRLLAAINAFKADLNGPNKTALDSIGNNPTAEDASKLVATINNEITKAAVGPRFVNFVNSAQKYAVLGNLCHGVWAPIQLSLTLTTSHAAYIESISELLMHTGLAAPQFERLAAIYPNSRSLQIYLTEYYTIVIKLCHRMVKF
jgi:hypothetical protein